MIDILYFPFPDYMHDHFGGFATYAGGRYRILIDNRQPEELQLRALKHEYSHIMLGHLFTAAPEYPSPEFDAQEAAADAYADAMTEAEFSALLSMSEKVYRDTLPDCLPAQLPEVIPA